MNKEYLKTTQAFQKLFIKNQNDAGIKNSTLEKAKGTWIDDIRLMSEVDKITEDQFRAAFKFLKEDKLTVIIARSPCLRIKK